MCMCVHVCACVCVCVWMCMCVQAVLSLAVNVQAARESPVKSDMPRHEGRTKPMTRAALCGINTCVRAGTHRPPEGLFVEDHGLVVRIHRRFVSKNLLPHRQLRCVWLCAVCVSECGCACVWVGVGVCVCACVCVRAHVCTLVGVWVFACASACVCACAVRAAVPRALPQVDTQTDKRA